MQGAPVSAGEIPELPYEVFKPLIGFLFHDSLSRQQLQFFEGSPNLAVFDHFVGSNGALFAQEVVAAQGDLVSPEEGGAYRHPTFVGTSWGSSP